MEMKELEGVIEGILFASGEPVSVDRIAAVLAVPQQLVLDASTHIADKLSFERSGIRLIRLENALQLCSAPEYADYIRTALETRKPPQLTPTALEVLSIVAYFQPATRAYIEQVRGVDSSYTVAALTERGLIEPCGTLDAPGRPTLFRTTSAFLRVFGISSLDELPVLPDSGEDDDEDQIKLKEAISALSNAEAPAEAKEETAETPEADSE